MSQTDLTVVSVFGRGNWLAMELAARGWKITLLDLSERFGRLAPQDIEGPFGLFDASDLTASQKTRLVDEGETSSAPQGLAISLPDGPLECHGGLTTFQLRARGVPELVESYLRASSALPGRESERDRKLVSRLCYGDSRLAQLAHSFAANRESENHLAIESGVARPIFTGLTLRHPTDAGFTRRMKNCQAAGIKVRRISEISQVIKPGRQVEAIIAGGEREESRAFAWLLSTHETSVVAEQVAAQLVPSGPIDPAWFWFRTQLEFHGKDLEDVLPQLTLFIRDMDLPWTSDNAFIVRKKPKSKTGDLWLRVPSWTRSKPDMIRAAFTRAGQLIEKRLHGAEVEVKTEIGELNPERLRMWPVYNEDDLEKMKTLNTSSFFFGGPETWESLDWLAQFRRQSAIVSKLEKLKVQWDNTARRNASREAARGRNPERSQP